MRGASSLRGVDFGELSAAQVAFSVILVVAFVLLITERLRNDVVAVLIVLALAASGVLEPAEAFRWARPCRSPGRRISSRAGCRGR